MDYDSFLKLVKERRTIRRFKPDPIPDEYVDKIIEAARWAPSGYNSQPWDFVVVKDKKLKDTIMQWIDSYWELSSKAENAREPWQRQTSHPWLDTEMDYHNAPVFIILFGDTRTQVGLPMMVRFDNDRRQSIFNSSLANAFLYMNLAATSLGLGAQWVSAIANPYVETLTKDLLEVPKEVKFYDMMAVGYPDTEPKPRLVRAKEEMVHHDGYDRTKFRTEQQVKDFIAALRQRGWTQD